MCTFLFRADALADAYSTESDFEVIPHLRSVIVLDDIATHDLTIDEPWEHIYGESESDDQGSTKEPSYAKILAPSK